MKKTLKYALFIFMVFMLFVGIWIIVAQYFHEQVENIYPEETTMIETKIQDIYFSDADCTASLTVEKEGGSDQIRLQKDTVIKDANGKERMFSDLRIGQSIRAIVHTDVLYDCLLVESDSDITDCSINIFVRCYEVTILD